MKNWRPVDWIVVMMAGMVALVLVSSVIAAIWKHEENPKRLELIGTLIASVIAIISLYVGSHITKKGRHDDDEQNNNPDGEDD